MAPTDAWKVRLYSAYVSTGQVMTARQPAALHFAPRAAYIRAAIRRHFPPDRDAAILDLACGDGAWLHFLREAGYRNVTGVDVSSEQIRQAHGLGLQNAHHGDLEAFLRSRSLVRTRGSAHAVLLFDILEHLTAAECFRVLDEVHRVLEPGGRCIIHVPNGEGIFGMAVRYGDLTHERAFTAQSVSQMFSAAGFQHIGVFEDRPVVHGAISAIRRAIWEMGTALPRLLSAAETGRTSSILSRNLLAVAIK